MDSLTHLVAGALTPIAFRGTPKRAAVIAFGIAAGELPDMDVIHGAGAEALLLLHRGITHALIWQPVQALFVVIPFFIWLYCRKAKSVPMPAAGPGRNASPVYAGPSGMGRFSFGVMYLAALIAVYTHIYLDCATTFGTRALLPFSALRVGFPAVFIVDLLLTLPALALLVLALKREPDYLPACPGSATGFAFFSASSRTLARIGLAWILIYPLLCLGVNAAATAMLAPQLAAPTLREAGTGERPRVFLMTEPFSPFIWKALIDEGPSYRMSTLFLLHSPGDMEKRAQAVYAKADPKLYAGLKRQNSIFSQFEDFAPLMVQEECPVSPLAQARYKEAICEYAFSDVRYIMSPESAARVFGRTDKNFILQARVTASGTLAAYRFLRSGADADHIPWESVE